MTAPAGHNIQGDRAETIRELVAESDAAALTSIDKALEAGRELVAAKADCRHGEWLPFLERAGVHERKAQRLMTLAKSGVKSDFVSDLGGIKGALEFLAKRDKAAKALAAAVEGDSISLARLAGALDLIDECAACFPEEQRAALLRHEPEFDLHLIASRINDMAPGAIGTDCSLDDLRRFARQLPAVGEGLIVWAAPGDIFNAGYVLPSRASPGHYYCLIAHGDSCVFTKRPILGQLPSGEYPVWDFLERHMDVPATHWEVEKVSERGAAIMFPAMGLEELLAEARAEMRMGDASGIRALIEQIAPFDSTLAA